MKERPLLFSAPMIRALLDCGRYDVSQHNAARVLHLPDQQIASLYRDGATIAELAEAYGCSRPTIAKSLDRAGVERRSAKQRPGAMSGAKNPAWAGGRCIRADGYVELWTPDGRVLEHRVIAERHLGRALRPDEIVHHINEIRNDNRPENLEVMTQSDHCRLHNADMHSARYGS